VQIRPWSKANRDLMDFYVGSIALGPIPGCSSPFDTACKALSDVAITPWVRTLGGGFTHTIQAPYDTGTDLNKTNPNLQIAMGIVLGVSYKDR
jgi:hypothetical protein